MKIKSEVLDILNNSKLENNVLFLPPQQLERSLYTDVNKVLSILGGKWDRKIKGHIFDSDVDEMLSDAINYGEITDKKKELQFFPTPPDIIRQMLSLANIKPTDLILEPSAGDGAIVIELLKMSKNVVAIEIDDRDNLHSITDYIKSDFLDYPIKSIYDKVIMNPPFSRQQDIEHIIYASKFLKPGGILVSVVSESPFFRQNKKSLAFREWLGNSEVIDLPAGAFKQSGTMVKTRIIKYVNAI